LLVALHDLFGSHCSLIRIFSCVTSGPALAEEVPALVERDLDGAEALKFGVREGLAGVGPFELVLFAGEVVDVSHDV
jgi:hypothetical protein